MAKTDATIGQNLQRLRGEMSQTTLANTMKERGHRWTQPTVVAVEKGERPLRLAEAVDIASILDERLDALLRIGVDQGVEQILSGPKRSLESMLDNLADHTADFARPAEEMRGLDLPVTAWGAREKLSAVLDDLETARGSALDALERLEHQLDGAEDELWTAIRTGYMGRDDVESAEG